jgi:excinuclease UvrABC nuclease subunit
VADPVDLMEAGGDNDTASFISSLEDEMLEAARLLDFERAAVLRDQIGRLKKSKKGK